MTGDFVRAQVAFLAVGESDGPEEFGLLAENAGDLLALFRFQDDRSKAIGDVTAGCQERGNEMLTVPFSTNPAQFRTDGQFGGWFPSLLAKLVAANALGGGMVGYDLPASFRITSLLKTVRGFRKLDPFCLCGLP